MKKGVVTIIALLAIFVGCEPVTNSTPTLLSTLTAPPTPDVSPFPTATVSAPSAAATSTPTPEPRKIPLRAEGARSDADYRLVEEKEVWGDIIAERLGEDEMMCVQHFDLRPVQCICWMGPLENAGVRGTGFRGMRRVVILGGSVEQVALALIDDWSADIRDAGNNRSCSTDHLTVSYDGGLLKPRP